MTYLRAHGLVALILVLGLAGGAWAQNPRAQDEGGLEKRAEASAKIDTKTETIVGLPWHSSLAGAIAANAKEKRDQRPILFMRLLGDLKGKT